MLILVRSSLSGIEFSFRIFLIIPISQNLRLFLSHWLGICPWLFDHQHSERLEYITGSRFAKNKKIFFVHFVVFPIESLASEFLDSRKIIIQGEVAARICPKYENKNVQTLRPMRCFDPIASYFISHYSNGLLYLRTVTSECVRP